MANYFEAAIPEPYRILGLALKPLSIGRYRLLSRFECGFVADKEQSIGIADLLIGLLICSMRCDEFLKFAESPNFSKEVAKWGRKVSSSPFIGMIPLIGRTWRRKHGWNAIEKINLFKKYLESSAQVPAYIQEDDASGDSAAHWSQSIEVILRSELNWTNEEINEQPISKAISDYFKWAENKGAIRLLTVDQLAGGEENAKIWARIGKQGGENGT